MQSKMEEVLKSIKGNKPSFTRRGERYALLPLAALVGLTITAWTSLSGKI